MIRATMDWLDDRTGYREVLHSVLYEPIPGGARWRYVWGSTLVFTFAIQIITGLCLWAAYSPSVQHAWASVFYVQEFMTLGWLVRGLHHYTAQAMVVLLAVHFLQVVIGGAYRAPREFNFWIGLILAQIVLALALTGYLLPWDQKGYYATQVATKIMGATPGIGPQLQQLVQGGPEYGQHTLTRFFALHAGLLPGLLFVFLGAHIYVFRRHGITAKEADVERTATGVFWPDQVLRDAVACLALLAVLLAFVWFVPADLSAPADPAEAYSAARPEWYFLSVFRFLKFEAVERMGLAFGAIIVPGLVVGFLFLMPLVAWLPGGHRLNLSVTFLLLAAAAGLTGLAWLEDRANPEHQAAVAEAKRDGARARELAARETRIPPAGAVALMRGDPATRGPRLYAQHCSVCHHYDGHDGRGRKIWSADPDSGERVAAKPTAADLGNLGSRDWMRAVLTDFENHFAPVKNAPWYGKEEGLDPDNSDMADWSGDKESLLSEENAPRLNALIEFLMAETKRPGLEFDPETVNLGREVATEGAWLGELEGVACTDCHDTIGEDFDPSAEGSGHPDIAKYLSYGWLTDFLRDPGKSQHYGDRNQMPAYQDRLSEEEMDLLVQWLLSEHDKLNQ